MSFIPTLTTTRLTLEPLGMAHAEALFEVYRDAETLSYWHKLPHRTVDETRRMISSMAGDDRAPWWAVRQTESGRVIGMVGFINALVPGMGYILHRDVWRQGYGGDAVRAAVAYGFEQLKLSRVELWIHHGNVASRRLAESVGFQQRGQFVQSVAHLGQYETLVYGLRAAEWAHGMPRWETAFRGVYPVIATRDVAGSVAFYRDMLGFHVSYFDARTADYAIVARGEWTSERAEIHFVHEADAALTGRLRLPVGPHIVRLLDELLQRGVAIAVPLNAKPWGQEFEIVDNNGWTLVFMG